MSIFWYITLITLSVLSWGFVDSNSPYPRLPFLYNFVHAQRELATVVYTLLFVILFVLYVRFLWLVKRRMITARRLLTLIITSCFILFVGFPGFSYDVFNYMATAKVTFLYKENPYIIMPIQIPNEPMLAYMHAANKVALYGPMWVLLSAIPHLLGFGNPLLTVFSFKLFVIAVYAASLWFLWRLSNKSIFTLAFFGLNPLVLTETVLNGHNDIVMMALALGAFYLLQQRRYVIAATALFFSILIKYATVFLVPIFIWGLVHQIRGDTIRWKKIWIWATGLMYAAFLLSPIREEIYAWYFIWPLTFVSLLDASSLPVIVSYGFTFGLPYRFAPFIYWMQWGGATPMIKKLVTFTPPILAILYGYLKKK